MKNKLIFKYTIVSLVIIASSCKKDFLENEYKQSVNDAVMFSGEKSADLFLNSCYNDLWKLNNTPDQPDLYSDDDDVTYYWPSYNWKQGIVTPQSMDGLGAFHYCTPETGAGFDLEKNADTYADWPLAFKRIRKCNTFIQQAKKYSKNFSPTWLAKRLDEARFLRAFTYGYMFMHYGGLPIITSPQSRTVEGDSAIQIPRSTFEKTLNFITTELDSIVKNNALPVKYNGKDADAGRATLGAALAFKGWLELFAASPAFNSVTPAACNGTAPTPDQIQLTGYGNYDVQRWAKAAATNKQFIDSYEGTYQLFPDLADFWREENEYNSEVIFDRQYVSPSIFSDFECFGGGPVWINIRDTSGIKVPTKFNWGNYDPTQELIDNYGMANGKAINDAGSGYDPQNPYVNRDPRFYLWVVYDGAPYKMDWMTEADTIYTRIDKVHPSINEIDMGFNDISNTGYYSRKRVNPKVEQTGGGTPATVTTDGLNYVFIRYAEVLLNYAEAQNEAYGPDATVYSAIDKIRLRAGIPTLEDTYGGQIFPQSEMRDIIHRERRIELSYENKRYYDLIRLRIAEDVLNKVSHGMMIANTSPSDNSGTWTYTVIPLMLGSAERYHVFTNKMYLLPLSQNTMDRNKKLIQNPGY